MSKAKDLINSRFVDESQREMLKQMHPDTEVFSYEDYLKWKKILQKENKWDELHDKSEEYKLEEINNPHDKIFRKLLDKKENAVEIINTTMSSMLPIKEENIEKYDSRYITEELRNSECDVVYKKKDEKILYLIEHQTAIDQKMAYRILKYKLSIIDSVIIDEEKESNAKDYRYPLIIAIVLYTGKRKWNAKLTFGELQEDNKDYKEEFSRYNILDINEISNKQLLESKTLITKLMLIEKSKDVEEFYENFNMIFDLFKRNSQMYTEEQKIFFKKAVLAISNKQIDKEKIKEIYKKERESDEDMLQIVETLREERERNRIEGRREGREEGKKEGKIEIIKNMLVENIPVQMICKVTGASKEEVEKLK